MPESWGLNTGKELQAQASVTIGAPLARIWEALPTPETIKLYFFGADVLTDWKIGSPIRFRGIWEGKAFEDKDTVLEAQAPHLLVVTHWPPLSGVPDVPENYHTVTYRLTGAGDRTELTVV